MRDHPLGSDGFSVAAPLPIVVLEVAGRAESFEIVRGVVGPVFIPVMDMKPSGGTASLATWLAQFLCAFCVAVARWVGDTVGARLRAILSLKKSSAVFEASAEAPPLEWIAAERAAFRRINFSRTRHRASPFPFRAAAISASASRNQASIPTRPAIPPFQPCARAPHRSAIARSRGARSSPLSLATRPSSSSPAPRASPALGDRKSVV